MGPPRHAARHAARRRPDGGPAGGLARTSALMVVGTVVSRATGFIRLGLQVAALGTGLLATTYNNANTVPASLYTLLIGGALNSVLVPQLVRARVQHTDGGLAHEQRLLTMVLCVLGVGTLLAVPAAPEIASLYLTDTPDHHAAFELTVVFARFLLPQILFYGLYAILGQLLNARNRFGAMMWTPVLNNVVLITLFGLYLGLIGSSSGSTSVTPADIRLLGIGTTVGIALQALALIPYLRACGFSFRPRFDWRGTGLRASVSAARWTLLFVAANLVAVTVVTRYATAADSALPHGGVGTSAYTYAQTIWQLPQSVITVSLVTALLPRLSRAVAEQRLDDVRDELSRGLRATGMVIVPAAFFFLAFGPEITALLPGHGPTLPMGRMLQAFALGLIPFSAQYLLLRGFYAFSDTRTPFWAALWISGLDIALAAGCHLLLPARWAVTGMAAAYSLSYLAGLLLTATRLRRRLEGRLDGRRLARSYGKLVLAAGVAAAASWAAVQALHLGTPLSAPAGAVAMGPLFLATAWLLRLPELRFVRRLQPFGARRPAPLRTAEAARPTGTGPARRS